MTIARYQMPDRIAESIAKICATHELSREILARLLAITSEQLSAWEVGNAILPAVTVRLHKLDRDLSFAGLAAWKRRLELSAGRELIVARDLRIVAITKAAFCPPPDPIAHHDYRDLPPISGGRLDDPRDAVLAKLEPAGFFDGRIRCVRADAELNYGAFAYSGICEIWPLGTLDAGIVAHIVFLPRAAAVPTRISSSVAVRQVEFFPTEAEGAFGDMSQEQERVESS